MQEIGHQIGSFERKFLNGRVLSFCSHRLKNTLGIAALCLGTGLSIEADAAFFHDRFNNANPEQQAQESPTKWVASNSGYSGETSTVTEANRLLTLTASQASGTWQPEASLYYRTPAADLNFWTKPVTIVINGLERSGNGIGAEQNIFLTIMSKSGRPSATTAAKFYLRVLGNSSDAVFMGWNKSVGGYPTANLISSLLTVSSEKNQIKSIILTLDGTGTQLKYNLSFAFFGVNNKDSDNNGFVDYNDSGMSQLAGSLSVSDTATLKSQWLSDNGVSASADAKGALAIVSRRTSQTTANTSVIKLDDVQIFEEIDNPMLNDLWFRDDFNNDAATQINQEIPHHWTEGTNYQSEVSEVSGQLILKALNGSTEMPYANIYSSEINTELNFWERPVGIHVSGINRGGSVSAVRRNLFISIMSTAINPYSQTGAGPKIELRLTGTDDKAGWKWTDQSGKGLLYESANNFIDSDYITVATTINLVNDIKIVLDGTGSVLKTEVKFFDASGTLLYAISSDLDATQTAALKTAWIGLANGAALGLTSTRSSADSGYYSEIKIDSVELFEPGIPYLSEMASMDRDFVGAYVDNFTAGTNWWGNLTGNDWNEWIPESRIAHQYYYAVHNTSDINDFLVNDIRPDVMPWGGVEYVNHYQVMANDPASPDTTRIQLNWRPETTVTDLLATVYVKLEDNFMSNMTWYEGYPKWRNLVEIRTYKRGGTDVVDCMRSNFGFESNATAGIYWVGNIEFYNGSYTQLHRTEISSSNIPVPVGKWFLMTVLYKHGIDDGIFEVRIRVCKDGGGFEGPWLTMCSFRNVTTAYSEAATPGIDFVDFMKMYAKSTILEDALPTGGIWQNFYRPRLWVNQ